MKEKNEKNCCKNCWHTLGKEFQWKKLGLSHEPTEEFFKSQWQKGDKSVLWLIYRWCMAACFTGGVIGSMFDYFNDGKWFIYLTDWGFFLCMFTNFFGAILVTIYYFKSSAIVDCKGLLKFYWFTHFVTLVLATIITVIYWSFIFPDDNSNPAALYNLWAHAFNSILMVLDHMLVAFPTNLLHLLYPGLIGLVYSIFTVIYFFSGGLDPGGNQAIYPILDWNKPGYAIITVVGVLIFMTIFGIIIFFLYKLRKLIHCKLNKTSLNINDA